MSVKTALACLFLLLISQVSLAAQKEWKTLVLPLTIDTKQGIKTIPAGWLASTEGESNQVAGITVYDGRPENKASLVPDNEEQQKAKKKLVSSWKLTPSLAEGIWLCVSYSATFIVLTKQLPQDITEFRVTYDTSVTVAGLNQIVRVEYR
jgi:hypothetical protein